MKTIKQAANEYADKHGFRVPYDGSNNFYDEIDVKASFDGFKAGVEFAQQWISVEDELPEIKEKPYQISVKTGNGHCDTIRITDNQEIDILKEYFTHWRPIERE